ncbi:ACTR6 [Cordylochernes scorpioides]|uniref:ACTR6 n=1 Tax=Cordylochernes scorpioides TaxID=51811 RepID=A0ABY6LA57_9ARAC|nr:ACTR6 [Cordylochernes scorpioides]
MNNERFTVPELLFHPSDVGLRQMGISEAVLEVMAATPEAPLVESSGITFECSNLMEKSKHFRNAPNAIPNQPVLNIY